jgi:hypothetical protein
MYNEYFKEKKSLIFLFSKVIQWGWYFIYFYIIFKYFILFFIFKIILNIIKISKLNLEDVKQRSSW